MSLLLFQTRMITLSLLLALAGTVFLGFGAIAPANERQVNERQVNEQNPSAEQNPSGTPPIRPVKIDTFQTDVYAPLKTLSWTWSPPGSMALTLAEVIEKALKHSPEIRLAEAKIRETQAKQHSVENKRVLLFFKYFNAQYIEGAAESDLLAAKESRTVAENQTLLEAINAYEDWMKSLLKTSTVVQSIRQGVKQVQLAQQRFDAGEINNLELLQVKTKLIQLNQELLSVQRLQNLARARVISFIHGHQSPSNELHPPAQDDGTVYYPSVLGQDISDFSNLSEALFTAEFDIPEQKLSERLTLTEAYRRASVLRSDLKELGYRRDALVNLVKANVNQFDVNQIDAMNASIEQAELRLEKAREALTLSLADALNVAKLSEAQQALAFQQKQLAETGFHQTQVSYKAGFASETELLDAEVTLAKAKAVWAIAQIEAHQARVKLLSEMGQLTVDTFSSQKSVITQ